jgi:hypothetical protein
MHPQPFIALARADLKREVPHAEARVTEALGVHWRPAGPRREVEMQLLTRRLETRRVQLPNGRGFGRAVDEIVESVDEPANARVAAHQLERR